MIIQYPSTWLQGCSLGESIACQLRLQIIQGMIEPGQILSENRIATDFGTSRSPVREALRMLASEGLITLQRMGALVVGLHFQDMMELYDVRYLIESFAWKQVSLNHPEKDKLIAKLEQIIDKMELAAKHQDYIEFTYEDLCFHETVIKEAQHARIWHLWTSIQPIVATVMLITNETVLSRRDKHLNYTINKHQKLIYYLQSGDVQTIQNGVEEYFADSRQTLHIRFPALNN